MVSGSSQRVPKSRRLTAVNSRAYTAAMTCTKHNLPLLPLSYVDGWYHQRHCAQCVAEHQIRRSAGNTYEYILGRRIVRPDGTTYGEQQWK